MADAARNREICNPRHAKKSAMCDVSQERQIFSWRNKNTECWGELVDSSQPYAPEEPEI